MLYFGNRHLLTLAFGSMLVCFSCTLDDTTSTTEEVLEYNNLEDFFAHQLSQTQAFEINNTQENTITATEGTVFNIPANTFTNAAGESVSGNISLQLVEAFSKADFILNNKSTFSDQRLTKSAGMLFVQAFSGEEQLQLNHLPSLSIPNSFSVQSPDEIGLFTAEASSEFSGAPVEWLLEPDADVNFANNFYEFDLDRLDWISLNHFYEPSAETTTVKITPGAYEPFTKSQYAFLIFDNINSVVSASAPVDNDIEFSGIPVGEDVTVLLVAIDDFAFYMGQQSVTISADTKLDINVQFTTESDLINAIKGFN